MTTLAMLAGLLVLPAGAAELEDIDGHWAKDSIERWVEVGVVQGDQTGFDPDGALTRGQYATILVNLLGLTEIAPNTYSDLTGDEWYADAILKCSAAGIMQGDGVNCNAGATITRQETTVMTARALGIAPKENADLTAFTDGEQVADWAAGYISAMAEAGIITGVGDGAVAPALDIDRASTMALLDKAIAVYANNAGATVEVAAETTGIVLVAAKDVTITGEVENLVVAQGAADGAVTLKDATVTGVVTVNAAKTEVALTGNTTVTTVTVSESAEAASVTVEKSAKVDALTAAAPNTSLKVEGAVGELAVANTAANTSLTVDKGATVTSVDTAADNVSVAGTGKVENMTVSGGEGTTISKDTTVSKVENNSESNVNVGDKEVKPDESTSNSGSSSGSSGSSGGGGGGGSVTPSVNYEKLIDEVLENGADTVNVDMSKNGDYAALAFDEDANTVTVSIKIGTVQVTQVYNNIINTLVSELNGQKELLKSISTGKASITLNGEAIDASVIEAFVKASGLNGANGGAIAGSDTISVLSGQTMTVTITDIENGTHVYTVRFYDFEKLIDDILDAQKDNINVKMTYANLSVGKENNVVTVTISDDNVSVGGVYTDIVGPLMSALNNDDNRAYVKSISTGAGTGEALITLEGSTVTAEQIEAFVKASGLKVTGATTIGTLSGRSFDVTITDIENGTHTYTVSFQNQGE